MKIYYGKNDNFIDVTDICIQRLLNNNIITIPKCDHTRAAYFSYVVPEVHKDIIIVTPDNKVYVYSEHYVVSINLATNAISQNENMIEHMQNKKVAILFFGLTRSIKNTRINKRKFI